ncbi:MAG: hypothetical protein JWP08_2384, partial [Bryobacterales bacterium]|nr:hypothetical protein [Bryobacterales bacterium]
MSESELVGGLTAARDHARCEREASVMIAIRRRAGLSFLAGETDESDATFAKHLLVFLSCPDRLGRPEQKGPLSSQ